MATIEENLKIIKESTAAMKSVIETNGGNTSGDITTWANSIQTAVDNGREGIIQTSLKYYDDGNGEVVPIKHPDLSTQPSILPYKFAGNYVYEQMVWFPRPQSEINEDNYQFTIEGTKIGETVGANPDNGDNVLLLKCDCTAVYNDGAGHQHTSIITGYKAYCFFHHCDIAFNDYSFYNDSDFKGCWFRLQYCLEPKGGGHYYAPESKYNFHIKGFEGLSFSIDGEPIDDSVKLPDNLVERFISGTDIVVEDAKLARDVMIECAETSESEDKTGFYLHAILFRHDTYYGVLSMEYMFPIAAERIQKGEKVTLIFKRA
jgi:hypothetical protein